MVFGRRVCNTCHRVGTTGPTLKGKYVESFQSPPFSAKDMKEGLMTFMPTTHFNGVLLSKEKI
jgi:hypothetical protein